ncbi:TolB family protein [Xinfangfangia sp. D13-10-4-6]|uniref:TolB family protein n=1 Tax=Pseudogemmobacter hezensis TaxID=2737662 RepID=UPI001554BF73|nr:PD40 domain-containing protein [Pseudogemmobacter hezensis]NPD16961.1 TolB family protein [Pseudogemmobacter hezensis]
MISILETITPDGAVTTVLRHQGRVGQERIEAPNWWPGVGFLVNSGGHLWRVPQDGRGLTRVSTGLAGRCNNDHGLTGDGRILFGSHYQGQGARIYAIPEAGIAPDAHPEEISSAAPSWWHGLSPDGLTMVYPAVRGSDRQVDIFCRALSGGAEHRLTEAAGHNDGPDFSHDGGRIYWNSDRSGHAQIWVMDADGGNQRQLFCDDRVNWFPHPSPCGRWLCWLSYPPGTQGHPADLPVRLMISDPEGQERRILREFIGGQGTINVPSWAPDGHAFAYIRYEL